MGVEWQKVCTTIRHEGQGIPATARCELPDGSVWYYCTECAHKQGHLLYKFRPKWSAWPERIQAQSTNERVQP